MQKILSIDLSFVMSPSLHLYEDWVLGTWTDTHTQWEMLNSKMGENPSACPRREKYLIKIFKKSLSNLQSSDQLKFSRNHLDIIDAIGNHSGLEIDNIDQHHDIFYSEWNKPHDLNDKNWMWFLDKKNQVEEYRWFCNKNSQSYDFCMPFHCEYCEISDRRSKPMTNPDFIFICESPRWVPPNQRTLFRTMQQLANNYFRSRK